MERRIHIACAAVNQTPLDWDNNFRNIEEACSEATNRGIDIICFPELSISGYNCEDMFFAPWVIKKSEEYLLKATALSTDLTIILGCAIFHEKNLYNCAVVIRDNRIHGVVPKQKLANKDIYYEYRWFTEWTGTHSVISISGEKIPFGKLYFSQNQCAFGIEICEDAWHDNRPAHTLIKNNIDIIFNLSASHFYIDKIDERIELGHSLVKTNPTLTYAYANLLGNESGRSLYDGSSYIVDAKKTIISPRFSFKNFEIITSEIVKTDPPFSPTSLDYLNVIISSKQDRQIRTQTPKNTQAHVDCVDKKERAYHEFTLATSLGIYDYLRKSGNQRIIISLSGGADSTACTILSHIGLSLACKSKGIHEVAKDLNIPIEHVLSYDYIYCVYQNTINNSEHTFKSAKLLCERLGVHFSSIDINDTIASYVKKAEEVLSTSITWNIHDIALQNIQARSRAPLIWLIANIKNGLLLSTSNRSESAVGYTTMDGDTCGGLSPIGGIDKSFILAWLSWLEKDTTYGDFSFLGTINALVPSAELRPPDRHQTDEDELMPFAILNSIEKLFIVEKLGREDIIARLYSTHPEIPFASIQEWVDKLLSSWRKNQWKRERYAPTFHVDHHSLDPKTWCRYPILSGKLNK